MLRSDCSHTCSSLLFGPGLPDPPSHVSILVTGASSLSVAIKEPEGDTGSGLITRYKGGWFRDQWMHTGGDKMIRTESCMKGSFEIEEGLL